ncbi:MAG: rhomboid family intramembrane serine protease [Planctomycetes bacterium]|nr:rhomboid family intramembrane serine protease [Planctomycetota bacterium]
MLQSTEDLPLQPADPDGPELPQWVELARTRDRRTARDLSLVMSSMGLEHGLFEQRGEMILVVQSEHAARAADELQRYERENANWPPRGEALGNLSEGLIGVFGWAAILGTVELLSRTQAMGLDWIQRGRGVASRELDGEVWRAITGLSLHLDLPHFLSNLVFGALFTLLVCELIGAGLGLSLIFASGALGNLLNSLLQPGEHASIGASTAVFAALGLLVTYQWRRRDQLRQGRFRRWAPLFAGAFLLASLGLTPDTRETAVRAVDYGAHATGFLAGALAGCRASLFRVRQLARPALQTSALVLAPLLFILAWSFAL